MGCLALRRGLLRRNASPRDR